jgi:transketolase
MLVLSRQDLPIADRSRLTGAEGVLRGAYVLAREQGAKPRAVLIASGSEVSLVLAAWARLSEEGIDARVVSMPSWELFREQPQSYRDEVLPPHIKARLAVEAGVPFGWSEWVGADGDVIGLTDFGASAPYQISFQHFGFTIENVVARARKLL